MQSKKLKACLMKGGFLHLFRGKSIVYGFVFIVDVMGQLCSLQFNITSLIAILKPSYFAVINSGISWDSYFSYK